MKSRKIDLSDSSIVLNMAFGKENASIYEDLPEIHDGKISIRVLALLPGTTDDPIRCQLQTVVLGDVASDPTYEALSYCWGDKTVTGEIHCNGRAISVTRNLETALRHLRLADGTRMIWADAVCINQVNVKERNHQVSIMSLIYRHAERVVVWLGEASDTTEQALWLLNKLADASERFGDVLHTSNAKRSAWWWPELKEFLGIDVGSLAHYRPGPIMALNKFMELPWFGRLWIVQEATSARDIHILCGDFHIPWRRLYDGLKFAKECGIADDNPDRPAYFCWSPFDLRLEQRREVGLLYLLQGYRYAGCADPRDKVFAHFGLTRLIHLHSLRSLRDEFASIGIVPDYDIEVSELYKKLAYGLIATKGNLDILSTLGLYETNLSLPSWVPDWTPSLGVAPLLSYTRPGSEPELYHASGESKASARLNQNTLVLKGFIYDTIFHVSDEYRPVTVDDPKWAGSNAEPMTKQTAWLYFRRYLDWFLNFVTLWAHWDYMAFTNARGTQLELADVYWQTLVCASKSDLNAYPAIFGQDMDVRKCRKLFNNWFRCRFFTRLAFNLGLSSSLVIFLICAVLDLFSMFLLTLGSPWQAIRFLSLVKVANRRLVRTKKGHLALVTSRAVKGDSIGIFQGGKTPLVMRPTSTGNWCMLGDGYVHGIMKGEIWDKFECEEIQFD